MLSGRECPGRGRFCLLLGDDAAHLCTKLQSEHLHLPWMSRELILKLVLTWKKGRLICRPMSKELG